MTPILHRVGPFLIYSYTVIVALGILAAIGLTGLLARQKQEDDWLDASLVCLAAGLVGGRLGFVLGHWHYFQSKPTAWLRFWQGGYSYLGALLAALVGLWLWGVWRKRPFASYTDLLTPGFALLAVFTWAACWLAGCAYGQETTFGLLAANLPDDFGLFAVRYQTQLLGLLWSLLIFIAVILTSQRWREGQLFWLTLGSLSLGYAAINLLRGDAALMIGDMRLDVLLNGTIVLFCGIILAWQWRKN